MIRETVMWSAVLTVMGASWTADGRRLDVAAPAAVRPAAGMLLVARRDLLSPGFSGSVVLLVRHDARGSFGVIVNRRTRFRLHDLLPDLEAGGTADYPVFIGGPVAPQSLVLVMRREKLRAGIERVTDEIAFSAGREILEALVARRKPAADLRIYIGYAGWGAGQLDAELAHGSWFIVPATADAVFSDDEQELWERLIDRLDPPGIRVQRPAVQAASGVPAMRSRPKAASASARSAASSSTGAG